MNKLSTVAALFLAAGMMALPALAQEAKKMEPPKPASGASQSLLASWNDIGRKLIAMAEDIPEDKYDFKPKPEMRSWLGQLLHAASGTYYFTNPVLGKPAPPDDPARDQFKSKADVVAFVKKSVEDGAAVIKAQGDAGLSRQVAAGGPQLTRLDDLAYGLIEHSGEHYGQLVVYYRLNGIVPPESRPKK
jgi:uncharacterized damage-inducible protein DinB